MQLELGCPNGLLKYTAIERLKRDVSWSQITNFRFPFPKEKKEMFQVNGRSSNV